jgi:hypothetical protein
MESNLALMVVFSAAGFGIISMLIHAIRFVRRGFNGESYRFDNNGMTGHQWNDFIGNLHENTGNNFEDCGDGDCGDGGCDS